MNGEGRPQGESEAAPLLAARAGVYRERIATGGLARYFQCYWSHRLHDDFNGRIAIVPDGCSDLIWAGERLIVVGPDRTSAFPELIPGGHILGLRFRAGAALGWLGTPLSDLIGLATPLGALWGHKADAIETRLLEAPEGERFTRLHSLLEVHEASDPSDDMQTLFSQLRRGAKLRELAGDIALGERTLRRRSQDHFGYGPKTLDRILRFQRFLHRAPHLHRGGLASLALRAGYADQAHMNREVKALSTLTPSEIRTQLSA